MGKTSVRLDALVGEFALGSIGFVLFRIRGVEFFSDTARCSAHSVVSRGHDAFVPLCRDMSRGIHHGCDGGLRSRLFLWQNTAGEYTALAQFFFNHVFSMESFLKVGALYDRYNFWIVFTAGFTPLPYKLFTITGGLFHINFVMFLLASVVSRGLRFFVIAWLIWRFGAPIKRFIDKYFNLLAIAFTVLLIGSFVLVAKLL